MEPSQHPPPPKILQEIVFCDWRVRCGFEVRQELGFGNAGGSCVLEVRPSNHISSRLGQNNPQEATIVWMVSIVSAVTFTSHRTACVMNV